MYSESYERLCQYETTPEALKETVRYVSEELGKFLDKNEPVMICFPDEGPASYGGILGQAVRECGGQPYFWGPDYRWKNLLIQTFTRQIHTIFAHPLVVLGLMKMAKATRTPLYIQDVLLGGYPYGRWMVEGIKKGLDCRVWGCYSIRSGPVITGFTCSQEAGIHLRDEVFDAVVEDEDGNVLSDPHRGRLKFLYRKDPTLVYDPQESAKLLHQPCSCGCDAPRIVGTLYVGADNPTKSMMEEQFLSWSSVLDYRAVRTESGVSLELVVFPGEPLPEINSCAKLTVRPWVPEQDIPFYIQDNLMKISENNW